MTAIEIIEKHIDEYNEMRKEKDYSIIKRELLFVITALNDIIRQIKEQENE